jgi:hypothetical protein
VIFVPFVAKIFVPFVPFVAMVFVLFVACPSGASWRIPRHGNARRSRLSALTPKSGCHAGGMR